MTTAYYEVPLTPTPQRFKITLSGVDYAMVVKWNPAYGIWVLDIATALEVPIVGGIGLVTGADLLAQYGYLGFVGQLFVETETAPDVPPTFDNLGRTSHLFYSVDDA